MLLSSRFSMWMAWGPELTFFCNDAYRRDTLGKKYPWALGRPAREVWAEIWPDIGPRIETVLRTGQATWDEALLLFLERSGVPEETYHTFSYSPLAGDDGRIEGMLCVVSEDTDRVIGERRLATLRDLGAGISGAAHRGRGAGRRARAARERPAVAAVRARLPLRRRTAPRLAAASGIDPPEVEWPLDPGESVLVEDASRLPPGDRPPRQALVLPLGQQLGFLVAGLKPLRPLDEGYRDFLSLVAGPDRRRPHHRARLRGGAPPRRDAARARPGQDRVLHQRQP